LAHDELSSLAKVSESMNLHPQKAGRRLVVWVVDTEADLDKSLEVQVSFIPEVKDLSNRPAAIR